MEEAAGQAGGRTVEAMAEQVYRALKEPGFQFDRSQGPAARRLPVGLGVLRAYAEAAVSELGPGGAALAEKGGPVCRPAPARSRPHELGRAAAAGRVLTTRRRSRRN